MQFFARAKNLLREETGAVAVYLAILLSVLLASAGVSIDAGRGFLIHTRLSNSLDAAGLAAGSTVSTTNLENDVKKYLAANVGTYLGAEVSNIEVTKNDSNTVIGVTAKAKIPTVFMKLFGVDYMTVSSSTEVTRAVSGLELVLVLDVTGSMAGQPLTDLKVASADLIDILFGANTTNDKLWIGIVPFSQGVNVGSNKTAWLNTTHYNNLNWGPTSWAGCVDARATGGDDSTDATPATRKFTAYYWPDDSNNDWIKNNGKYNSGIGNSLGPNRHCPVAVQTLTNDKTALKNKITSLQAVGLTHVNIGAVWGWRMLSPNWRNLWGGLMDTNKLPLDYNTPKMNKAVVIMTDGENTFSTSAYTAYGYISEKQLGTTNSSTAVTQMNTRLTSVCNSMKNNNIIVYTIAFNKPGSSIEKLLKNCASAPEFYFDSPTGSDLKAAFRAIGDSLSNLRISK